MKAIWIIAILVVGSLVMGGSFYYVLQHAPSYQATAAEGIKTDLLAEESPIEVQTDTGELWVFPKDPQSWTVTVLGEVLKVKPSTPSITREGGIQTYADISQAPTWPTVQKRLKEIIFERLRFSFKPENAQELEVLAP